MVENRYVLLYELTTADNPNGTQMLLDKSLPHCYPSKNAKSMNIHTIKHPLTCITSHYKAIRTIMKMIMNCAN